MDIVFKEYEYEYEYSYKNERNGMERYTDSIKKRAMVGETEKEKERVNARAKLD